ncbi:MAG: Ca-activated chloride channel family protein [Candidatus Latescibacterota bacterium]|jgi:Ca-activated chloride channel family protein
MDKEMRVIFIRYVIVVLMLPLFGFTFLDPVAKKNEAGNDLFDKGEYDAALAQYLDAQQNAPSRLELGFNVGDALYKQGKYDEAAQALGRVLESENQSLSAGAYYNLGNTFFRQEKYQEAVGAYKKALMMNPNDQDAKVNLELALEKLQDQDKQDEDNKDQDKDDKDQDKKDQDKQDQDKQDQDKQDQDKQDQDKQDQDKQDQDKQDQDKQDQQNQDQQNQDPDQPDQQQTPKQPGELTPEEAARILDAMKDRDAESQKRRKIRVTGRRYNGNAW